VFIPDKAHKQNLPPYRHKVCGPSKVYQRTDENHKTFHQTNTWPCQDSNQTTHRYKSQSVTTTQTCSVWVRV